MIEATKKYYNINLEYIGNRVSNNPVERSFGFKKNQLLRKVKNQMPSSMLRVFYMDIKAKFLEHYEKTYEDSFKKTKFINKEFVEKFRNENLR